MSRPLTAGDGARTHGDTGHHEARRRSPAQWFCLLGGLALVLAGLLGFIADATFDTAASVDTDQLQGDGFLGFEVNGWHNVVHIATGLLLLVGAWQWALAKTVALVFGLAYGLVTIIGIIDGNDVLGIIPVNTADNILHLALSALGIIAGLLPSYGKGRDGGRDRDADRARDRDAEVRREPVTTTATTDGGRSEDGVGRTERPEVEPAAEIGERRAERDRQGGKGRHPDRL